MRKWMKTTVVMACMAALLAGCGAKAPAELQQPEEKPVPEPPVTEADPVVTAKLGPWIFLKNIIGIDLLTPDSGELLNLRASGAAGFHGRESIE